MTGREQVSWIPEGATGPQLDTRRLDRVSTGTAPGQWRCGWPVSTRDLHLLLGFGCKKCLLASPVHDATPWESDIISVAAVAGLTERPPSPSPPAFPPRPSIAPGFTAFQYRQYLTYLPNPPTASSPSHGLVSSHRVKDRRARPRVSDQCYVRGPRSSCAIVTASHRSAHEVSRIALPAFSRRGR